MEQTTARDIKKTYQVIIETLVTEGRVFQRGDVIAPDDAPGEIESLLHAGLIAPVDSTQPVAERTRLF